MSRVLVVTLPEKGHYHPLIGPALELMRRGAEVAFAASVNVAPELAALGIPRAFCLDAAGVKDEDVRGARLAALLQDAAALEGWIRKLLVEDPASQVDPLRRLVRDFRPDVVAIDTMAYAGAIAAELEGIPWVGWATSLNPVIPSTFDSPLIRTTAALEPARQSLFREHGLSARFRVSDVLSERGTATFTTEDLVGACADASVHLVGPSVRASVSAGNAPPIQDGPPLVYVSFGSQAWHQPRRYELLIDALSRLKVKAGFSLGELAAEYQGRGLPQWVRCVEQVDQPEVLRRASVVVTHGGANSVMEALTAGVPMLVAPLCNDQPHNLAFVERAGAGIGIDLEQSTPGDVAAQLGRLMGPGTERSSAQRIQRSYRERSGNVGAAQLTLRAIG